MRNPKKAILSSVLTLALVGLGAWAFGFFHGTDPAIAALQDVGKQMRDNSLSDAQRNQLRTDFRQQLGSLSEDQRRAFFDANRSEWNQRMQQRMDEYFAMSKADQQKRLDEILNRIVQARNSQQQNANGQGTAQGNRGGNGNRGGGRNMSDAARQARAKQRLDNISPKQRAQFAEFRRQLDTRAQQRGIQLGNGPGGGFGFGGGRRGA